ncbi:Sec-independent protein translocase protein TatB [Necropsobacter massiliensis]|uniref:Sec-independent protein translocase protein TatB n=1 Tax=Necropsobacter massiliensis TaxID=1400001 RepID=UPI0005963469|nr:Sec-independent protein translocase protein TatB [Necropsobacter massiliensis]
MFDIGFSELVLILIVGLVVLGPQRLPVAIRTVMGWVRTIRGMAANVQNELNQELKLQELQDSIKKAEHLNLQQLSPELGKTVEELRASAQKMKADLEKKAAATNTDFQQQIRELKDSVEKAADDSERNTQGAERQDDLSPAELAELAEQDDPITRMANYYPEEDTLANVTPTEKNKSAS